jgi:hypothetical protein
MMSSARIQVIGVDLNLTGQDWEKIKSIASLAVVHLGAILFYEQFGLQIEIQCSTVSEPFIGNGLAFFFMEGCLQYPAMPGRCNPAENMNSLRLN